MRKMLGRVFYHEFCGARWSSSEHLNVILSDNSGAIPFPFLFIYKSLIFPSRANTPYVFTGMAELTQTGIYLHFVMPGGATDTQGKILHCNKCLVGIHVRYRFVSWEIHVGTEAQGGRGKGAQFSSGWYLRAQEIPYALRPISQKLPRRCHAVWNICDVERRILHFYIKETKPKSERDLYTRNLVTFRLFARNMLIGWNYSGNWQPGTVPTNCS